MFLIFVYLEGIDLILQSLQILLGDALAGDLSLHLIQPLVQVIDILRRLTEFLLHRFL